jgi:hypothetical protein
MRTPLTVVTAAVLACLATEPGQAQDIHAAQDINPADFIREGVPKMPNPPGPAPGRSLSGVWVGPQDREMGPMPPMTPAGQALFEARYSYRDAASGDDVGVANDPFITCDPLGFPRNLLAHAVSSRGRFIVGTAPDRILIAYEQQRVWREIWMDGRALPEQVDVRGAPESRLYGYSVGRWEGDHTLVIETTGLDERPWLDEVGHPRSSEARIEERYTRLDEYNVELTVTIDDPKFYTQPWTWMTANFYWVQGQEFAETFCIPSEGIAYRDALARPSGIRTEIE